MSKPVAIVKIIDEETGEVLRDSTMVPLYLTNPYDNWSKKYLAKIHYAELKGDKNGVDRRDNRNEESM